jgi:predicted alpha/beta-hydrolase family hydrolase
VSAEPVTIALENGGTVSGLWQTAGHARRAYVFAHGAGTDMTHKSMSAIADGLLGRGVAVLRYNFPYTERGSKRPDAPALAHPAVRAAVAKARELTDLPLFAGGRSFGGRMTSQAQALGPLPDVRGLVFFAFPLHPAGKPGDERAKHLADVQIPMLFVQGARDSLAEITLLKPVVQALKRASLSLYEDADHAFHVPARTGRKDSDVLDQMLDAAAAWMDEQR